MANEMEMAQLESPGTWAKLSYFAGRALMERALRPYDLGPTQWYVLHKLATTGATNQRDFVRMLQIDRATITGVVRALVRKGLVIQQLNTADQRQKVLDITSAGRQLWKGLPDPIALNRSIAFTGVSAADIETTIRVLKAATERLTNYRIQGSAS